MRSEPSQLPEWSGSNRTQRTNRTHTVGMLDRIQALVGRPRGSAETVSAPRERSGNKRNEIGWGGAKVFGGIVLDEYNPDLKGRLALQIADKMRRTTGQIRALEQVIRLPIESTQWIVEEPRQAGSAEREAAELLRENLFDGMECPFSDVIREACLAIQALNALVQGQFFAAWQGR